MSIYSPYETERLVMREFSEDDYKDVDEYLSDEKVLNIWVSPLNGQQAEEYINKFLYFQTEEPRRFIKFAVIQKESNHIIGECGINICNLSKTHRGIKNE